LETLPNSKEISAREFAEQDDASVLGLPLLLLLSAFSPARKTNHRGGAFSAGNEIEAELESALNTKKIKSGRLSGRPENDKSVRADKQFVVLKEHKVSF
jgi:hypothetical protein